MRGQGTKTGRAAGQEWYPRAGGKKIEINQFGSEPVNTQDMFVKLFVNVFG